MGGKGGVRLSGWRKKLDLGKDLLGAAAAGRRTPLFVGWCLTDACNMACSYCGRRDRGTPELPVERTIAVATELVDAGVYRVALTGGEPLQHQACLPLMETLVAGGVQVSLNSNGVLLPRYARRLRGLVSGICVSLDGGREAHDRLRGEGSWDRVMAGARAAREAGIPLSFHCVLSASNVDQVVPTLRLAGAFGARVGFAPLERVPGQGRGQLGEMFPTRRQWAGTVRQLLRYKRNGDRRIQNSVAGLTYLERWPDWKPIRCSAGLIYARLEPDGALHGCGNLVLEPGAPSLAQMSFSEAFASLASRTCRACWCDTRVEMNLVLSGVPSAIIAAMVR